MSSPIFAIEYVPFSVRLRRRIVDGNTSRAVSKWLTRLADACGALGVGGSRGRFSYIRNGTKRIVSFDGRNAQFHALYDFRYRAGYEYETAVLFSHLVTDNTVFYDVGANWGYFSLFIAALPKAGVRCYAFEPNPSVFGDLTSTIAQAGVGDSVVAINQGVGETEGSLFLERENKFLTGLGRLSNSGSGPTVSVVPLDRAGLPPPSLIKIDAEGMETAVLKGAKSILADAKPMIVFENFVNLYNSSETTDPIKHLLKSGYRCFVPALRFQVASDQTIFSTYGEDFPHLLTLDGSPTIALLPVGVENRYLLRSQLNLFACHESRLGELSALGLKIQEFKDFV